VFPGMRGAGAGPESQVGGEGKRMVLCERQKCQCVHVGEGEAPVLTDEDALKLLRLMRVMRRLRELQRGLTYGEDNSDE